MSHFIPKKTLKESMASNPLDAVQTVSNDITKKAQEGILTAIAAETDAVNQYTQILDLIKSSEAWLIKNATPVIEDIMAEEKKHLGQLTELVSNLPAFEKEMDAGKEETETGEHKEESKENVTESVKEKSSEPFSLFDSEIIFDLLENKYHIAGITDDFVMEYSLEMYPSDVDDMLAKLNIDPNILPEIENDIIEKADIKKNKIAKNEEEELENAESDLHALEKILDPEESVYYIRSPEIRDRVYELMSDVRSFVNSKKNK